jgi:uncharacterized protein YcbK (DUF882 family)
MSILIREPGDWNESWENFKPKELSCSHCKELKIDTDLMNLLQKAREELGPIVVSSGYRCPEHNNNISKKTGKNGPHTTGKAIDLFVTNGQERKRFIDYFTNKVTGLGISKSFIHIDLLGSEDGFEMRPNSWVY